MKIAVFTDSFLPYVCGATFAILNQINELAERGHKITVFCPKSTDREKKPPKSSELHPNIHIHETPLSIPYPFIPNFSVAIPSFRSSLKGIKKLQPDVIHVHTEWGCGWEGLLIGKFRKIPVVGTFHTFWDDPLYIKNFPIPNWPLTRRLIGKYSALFYRKCDAVIAPSQTVKNYLKRKDKKVNSIVVSNGIPKSKKSDPNLIQFHREKVGLNGQPAFLYIGRISAEKSIDLCLEAFKEALKVYPGIRFVIIGDGPSSHQLKKKIKSLKLEPFIHQLGLIDHLKLIQENIPQMGDVFVTASETENQPISILEAMSFGLPVIGPKAKGIPELVKDGENGYLFEPGNIKELSYLMKTIIANPQKRQSMGVLSKVMAERHSIKNTATKLEELYQQYANRN